MLHNSVTVLCLHISVDVLIAFTVAALAGWLGEVKFLTHLCSCLYSLVD